MWLDKQRYRPLHTLKPIIEDRFQHQEKMDIFENHSYVFTCRCMSYLGQWPYQTSKRQMLPRLLICTVALSGVTPLILKLITSHFAFDTVIEILPLLLSAVVCFTKYLSCWFLKDTMKYLLEHIKQDWYLVDVKAELDILYNIAEEGRLFKIYYLGVIYISYLIGAVTPFLPQILDVILRRNKSRELLLPYQAEYFVNNENYLYLIYGHIYLLSFVFFTIMVISDFAVITFLFHACGMFSVLGHKLEHVYDNLNDDKEIHRNFMHTVIYHRKILQYINIIQTSYTTSCVIQALLSLLISIILLFRCFIILTAFKNIGNTTVNVLYTIGHYFVLLCNIIPGQKLIDHSNTILFKAYCGNWYMAPSRMQKMLLLVMVRSREPVCIRQAYFLTISFELYASLLQTSLSYFMALLSLQQWLKYETS